MVAERLLKWQPDLSVMYCCTFIFIDEHLRTQRPLRMVCFTTLDALYSLEVHRIRCPAQVLSTVVAHKGQVSLKPACIAHKRGVSCVLGTSTSHHSNYTVRWLVHRSVQV